MKKSFFAIILSVFISIFCFSGLVFAHQGEKDIPHFSFGIVPQQSAQKLARLWGPILQYLSERTGYHLQFRTAPNIPEFEQRLLEGKYDIAYMNPYHYTVFHTFPGYNAFARQKDKKIQGIIVVRNDSSLQTIQDLAGETLSFPAPAAFAASLLPRSYLIRQKIPFTSKFVSSHDSVYQTVVKNIYAGGGGIIRTLNNSTPETRKQLRILWQSQFFTPHAFAAHPRLSQKVIQKIQFEMVNMHQNEKGKRLLKSINFTGMVLAQDKDWDDVRGLGIDLLNQLIREKK